MEEQCIENFFDVKPLLPRLLICVMIYIVCFVHASSCDRPRLVALSEHIFLVTSSSTLPYKMVPKPKVVLMERT